MLKGLDSQEDSTSPGFALAVIKGDRPGLKAGLGEQAQPGLARKEAQDVAVTLAAEDAVLVFEQVSEVDKVGGVVRIRVPGPFEITHTASFAVMPAVIRGRFEGFAHVIGSEEGGAARPAVNESGFNGSPQVGFADQDRKSVV